MAFVEEIHLLTEDSFTLRPVDQVGLDPVTRDQVGEVVLNRNDIPVR